MRNRPSTIHVAVVVSMLMAMLVPSADGGEILEKGAKLYSQKDEELIIRDFFNDRKDGFFVDVGAFHWERFSTTNYLEKHLGWKGIAIDAQEQFADGYKQNRPNTKFFSYAITDRSGETIKLYLGGAITSTDADWHENFAGAKAVEPKAVDVPTITLNDLLEKNEVEKIDFLSMDIEGGEVAALAGFDIEKYKPDLVCIEASQTTRDQILAYFGKHDFERIDDYLARDRTNWYFRKKQAGAVSPKADPGSKK